MSIAIEEYLLDFMHQQEIDIVDIQVQNIKLDAEKIKVIMINEALPQNRDDYFYSDSEAYN